MEKEPVYVTKPSLGPLEDFVGYLEQIWSTGVMTHNGPLMQQLEKQLSAYLDVSDTVCLANGTSAMQLAIRALDLQGEVITTPFTFIASASSIVWERCTPVFVDIEPGNWNIDPLKIEQAITARTCAILPVHVFSAPCDVKTISEIARHHDLKVIYDAAHAMCVKVNGQSIMRYGDISCTSFHATKIYNTCEGGACFSDDPALNARIRRLRFFGFDEEKNVVDAGINAKMTEISAALGLVNLKGLDQVQMNRRRMYQLYQSGLVSCAVTFQQFNATEYNYSYMPVLFESEEQLLRVEKALQAENIFPRRYFYPPVHTMAGFQSGSLPVAESVSSRILCLPLYDSLQDEEIAGICRIVSSV